MKEETEYEPIWRTQQGDACPLYSMETQHIKNTIAYLYRKKDHRNWSNWILLFEHELQAREGESPLWRQQSYEDIMKARAMRRMVLGLPPMGKRREFPKTDLGEPEVSLF